MEPTNDHERTIAEALDSKLLASDSPTRPSCRKSWNLCPRNVHCRHSILIQLRALETGSAGEEATRSRDRAGRPEAERMRASADNCASVKCAMRQATVPSLRSREISSLVSSASLTSSHIRSQWGFKGGHAQGLALRVVHGEVADRLKAQTTGGCRKSETAHWIALLALLAANLT